MPAPLSVDEFLDLVRKSGVVDEKKLDAFLEKSRAELPAEPAKAAEALVQAGVLTNFQADNIREGKWKRFTIGKYKILERLGSGGFAQVYLCEHMLMRRRVAVKVLPAARTKGSSALERFHREARALNKLDHPNIVHFYDLDVDGDLHFIVMEFVDGSNLQEIVKKSGPLSVARACHYISQAALALQHAHDHEMIHRDIKPGNILVDRTGAVKLLDMGLALRAEGENSQLTRMHEDGTLGTADYISPEQVLDSHDVDIRTDIYSLGGTFYFLLTGWPPFDGMQIADKLMAHQLKQPRPITEYRQDVPAGVIATINKMMAKNMTQRYATPGDVAKALEPFATGAPPPPPTATMPKLSPAASIGAAPSPNAPETGEDSPWNHSVAKPGAPRKPGAGAGKSLVFTILLVLGFCVVPSCLGVGSFAAWWFTRPAPRAPEIKGPRKLEVGKNAKYPSIKAALRDAEIDTIIELADDAYDEAVVLDGSKERSSIILQAAPGKKEIVWRSGKTDAETPILRIIKAPDFKLKGDGIILDGALGKGRVNDLIVITGDCNGMALEDLQFRNFGREAILIMNAAGADTRPIVLRKLWTFSHPSEKPRAAIYFDVNPKVTPAKNAYINIVDCKLEPDDGVRFNKKADVFGDGVHWPEK